MRPLFQKRSSFFFLILLTFFAASSLKAVEFVLFTQPKTGTHLLIPILSELMHKTHYWAPEYKDRVPHHLGFEEALQRYQDSFFYGFGWMPWDREKMDLVWNISKKKNAFLHLHSPHSLTLEKYLTEKNCVNFFVKRDPRDQIVSLMNHYKYLEPNDEVACRISSDDERLLHMIRKKSRPHTIHYMNWLRSSRCCVLDFAKLMGAHGGVATHEEAMGEMRKIAKALELNVSDRYLEKVYQRHWGKGWSFFKGKVGSWKDYFKEEHKLAIKEEIGDLLIELGFEKDQEW